jgi:hypothetical protein
MVRMATATFGETVRPEPSALSSGPLSPPWPGTADCVLASSGGFVAEEASSGVVSSIGSLRVGSAMARLWMVRIKKV